jgi:C4-dicarboxylate-binding protein DctP
MTRPNKNGGIVKGCGKGLKFMRRAVLAVVSLWFFAAAAAAGAEEPIVIRFSHVVAEDTPKGIGARLFEQRAEARFPGRVDVEVFPSSQKFTDEEVLVALLFGDVEMAAPSFTLFRSILPIYQVYELPFMFQSVEQVHRFQGSGTGQRMLNAMRDKGLRGLAYWDNGMRVISADKPLVVPADAEGLVFRIEPSAIFQAQYQRINAVAIQMPFRRVADAIRDGVVDGQENSWSNIYSRGIQKLQRNFTELNHSFLGYMVVTNDAFWSGLPDDIRTGLEEILAEVTLEVQAMAEKKAVEDRANSITEGDLVMVYPTDDQRALWRDAWLPVWSDFEGAIGSEIIDAAVASGENR